MRRISLKYISCLVLLSFLIQIPAYSFDTSTQQLSAPSKINNSHFKELYTAASICRFIEQDGTLDNKSYLNNLLDKLEAIKTNYENIYVSILPYEVIIEIPNEGMAVRYFDPTKANVITPYSDISKLQTKVISPRLNRQIIHRIKALSTEILSEHEINSATQICEVFKQNHIVPSYTAGRDIVKPGSQEIADGLVSFNKIFEISRTKTRRSIEASCEDISRAQAIAASPFRKEIDITYHMKRIGETIINLASEKSIGVIENPDSELYQIVKILKPEYISLHLGWSAEEIELGTEQNLLPDRPKSPVLERGILLDRITKNLISLQKNLKKAGYNKPILIETLNYSNSGAYEHVTDPDFVKEVLRRTGARLLIDCAHVLVSAKNMGGYNPDEYMKYVKALVSEETIGLVDEIHLSVPEVVSPSHYEDMHRPLYSNTVPAREVIEILRYILTLRAEKGITRPITVNFETGIQNADREMVLLSRWIQTLSIGNQHLEKIYEYGESGRPAMKATPTQITCNKQLKDLFEFRNGAWNWKQGNGLTLLGGLPFEGTTRRNFDEILNLLRGVEPEFQNLYTHQIDTLHFTIEKLIGNTDGVSDNSEIIEARKEMLASLQKACAGIGPVKVRFYYKDLAITEGGDIVALGYVDNDGLLALRDRARDERDRLQQNEKFSSFPIFSKQYTRIVHVTIGRIFDENMTSEKLEKYKRVISDLRERKGRDDEPKLLGEITITEAKIWDQRCETNELRHGKGHAPILLTGQGRASTSGTSPYFNYTSKNKDLFSDMLGIGKPATLLRVPVEAIESISIDNIKDFLATFQEAPNAYIELYYMSGIGEVSENVYQKYGLQNKPLPKDFKRTRENTVTLFPALKGEEMDQAAIVSRLGTLNITPENTILSPIGLQYDPAGLIRATILGLKIMDIAREIKEKGIDIIKDQAFKDRIQLEILEQLKNVCDVDDLKNFNLSSDDIIALATGTINNIIVAIKKLIKLLPITPINAEELRQIYEHAKQALIAA